MKQRHMIVPAVYLLIEIDHRILMLRRRNTGYMDGQYSLVAGHLDGGESLSNAIIREAREEVGIDVDPASLTLVHVMHTPPEPGDPTSEERIDFYFRATRFNGFIQNCEPEKCDDIAWFDLSNLPKNTVPRVREALAGIIVERPISELYWSPRP